VVDLGVSRAHQLLEILYILGKIISFTHPRRLQQPAAAYNSIM
jgi:hypothetical protein